MIYNPATRLLDMSSLADQIHGQMECLEIEPYGRTPAGHVRVRITLGDQGEILEIRSRDHQLRDDDVPRFCEVLARRIAHHLERSPLMTLDQAVGAVGSELGDMIRGKVNA